jgi:hypothetical protein
MSVAGLRTTWIVTFTTGLFIFAPVPPASPETRTVVAGARYRTAPGGQHWILGRDYRDLWAAPIEVEVLDLNGVAGGLSPVMRVGGRQTLGLAMKGADGRDYTFRAVDKGVGGLVPEEFLGTAVEEIAQDQIAASFPAAEVVVPRLAETVGILEPEPRLVVMPDDPALGEFQRDFAGVLGVFMEYPRPVSPTSPGFHGATAIVGHPEIWKLLDEGPENRVDTRAFLRARLLDLLVGDWDRHRKQWRWAKIPGTDGLQPVPEDRDQALSDYEGLALDMARLRGLNFLKFEKEYASIGAWSKNGWDVDRYLLTDIEKQEWMAIARDVQSRVTDSAIDEALRSMPPEYFALRGAEMAATLRARRDALPEAAERYYRTLAQKVDIYGTAKAEVVSIDSLDDGDVEVRVALASPAGAPTTPYYRRHFDRHETGEVRIYLEGGDDRVETSGRGTGAITIRVIGGPGNDRVDDSKGRKLAFYDFEGDNRVEGKSGLHDKPFVITGREDEVPAVPPRDWGRFTQPLFLVGYHPDPGVVLGGGFDTKGYGFRQYPWGARHVVTGGIGLRVGRPFFDYAGDFRRENAWLQGSLHVRASGLDQLRYYGLGNETTNDLPDESYRVSDTQVTIFPALAITRGARGAIELGPILKYSDSGGTKTGTVLADEHPYGAGTFGEVGFRGGMRFDATDPDDVLGGGIRANLAGAYYPRAWDVERSFGSVDGELTVNVPLGHPAQLSIRTGGKKLWGDYPFFEAAYIGGGVMHGYNWDRFAGDASLFSRLELKWAFASLKGSVPMDIGLSVGADAGRVWLSGESSNKWHTGIAGGMFFTPFNRLTLIEFGVGKSEEKTFFVFGANLRIIGF